MVLKRVLLAMLAIPIVMIGSVAATAEDDGQSSGWSLPDIEDWLRPDTGGVRVPVVLDGVKLSAEEFNELDRKLNGQAAIAFTIWYSSENSTDPTTANVLKEGRPIGFTFYAFSTEERYNAWLAARGLPPFERPTPTESNSECRLLPDGSAICGEAKELPSRPGR